MAEPAPAGSGFEPGVDLTEVARSVASRLRDLAAIGRRPEGGWSRLAFSPEEREAHRLFSHWSSELGWTVSQDAIGNTYADLPGTNVGPRLVTGSHLDTIPGGGNFDGAAGVVAAVEAGRLLAGEALGHPLRLVVFAAEEGARFTASSLGARAVNGQIGPAQLGRLRDENGISALEAARAVGLRPDDLPAGVWPAGSVAAYLELHIEQGRVLEETDRRIGVVDAIAGSTRIAFRLSGRADHSGTTPMSIRQDALAGAAEIIAQVERAARRGRTTVATVGRLQVHPNVVTVVPGEVRFTLDVRDIDPLRQRELAGELLRFAALVASRRGLGMEAQLLQDQSPVTLPYWVRDSVAEVCREQAIPYRVMPSGAGHDAGYVGRRAPAGMIFVPSRAGISHAPDEWTEIEDIARGALVLAAALRRIDTALRRIDAAPPPVAPAVGHGPPPVTMP